MTVEHEDTHNDDDTTDLSKLDRGDALPSEDRNEKNPLERERDEKGKFAKKGAPAEEAEGEEEEEEEDEAEDEVDDEAEDEAEDETEDDTGGGKKPIENAAQRLDRAKKQRDRERAARVAAEARIAELERQSNVKPEPKEDPVEKLERELDDLYVKVEEARNDGDAKTAAQLQRDIDRKNREIVKIEAGRISAKTTAEMSEDERYNALIDSLEGEYAVLQPRHEDYDPEAVRQLEYYAAAHEKMGMPASKALARAAFDVLGYGKPRAAAAAESAPGAKPLKKPVDVNKVADTSKRQPPDVSDRGVNKDSQKIRVTGMSEADFNAIPKSKLKQLRGDMA